MKAFFVTYSGMTIPIVDNVGRKEAFDAAKDYVERIKKRHPHAFGEISHVSPGHWEITDNGVLINDFNGNLYVEADA